MATPNHTHGPVARIALERGRPVLVEKPLTTTFAEAEALCDLARRRGTFISVGFVTRHYPVVSLVKELLDDGVLGTLERFDVEYGFAGGWPSRSGYVLDARQAGGGALVTLGTHVLDRVLHWFGWPERLAFADDGRGGVEATCQAWLEFPSGLRGELFISKALPLRNRFTLRSDRFEGALRCDETATLALRPRRRPERWFHVRGTAPVPADAFQAQLEEFARIVRHGGTPTVDGPAGAQSVKLCEALYACRRQLDEPWAWYRREGRAPA